MNTTNCDLALFLRSTCRIQLSKPTISKPSKVPPNGASLSPKHKLCKLYRIDTLANRGPRPFRFPFYRSQCRAVYRRIMTPEAGFYWVLVPPLTVKCFITLIQGAKPSYYCLLLSSISNITWSTRRQHAIFSPIMVGDILGKVLVYMSLHLLLDNIFDRGLHLPILVNMWSNRKDQAFWYSY